MGINTNSIALQTTTMDCHSNNNHYNNYSEQTQWDSCEPQRYATVNIPLPPAGKPGCPGQPGCSGRPGVNGRSIIGPCGPRGPCGPCGKPGMPGPCGPMGPRGATGLRGASGLNGMCGKPGAPGAPGAPGMCGPPGPPGAPGVSACDSYSSGQQWDGNMWGSKHGYNC